MSITISRMTKYDINQVLKIQAENQRNNLTPSQQKNGYLSIAFSEDELNNFNKDLCVAIAKKQDEVVGYCCISSAEFNSRFPILDRIIENLSSYSVPGAQELPSKGNTCIHGPVCISLSQRGNGVLEKMASFSLDLAKKTGYLYCFSFISSENTRSLKAHIKLPFREAGRVNFNGKEFIVMACKL